MARGPPSVQPPLRSGTMQYASGGCGSAALEMRRDRRMSAQAQKIALPKKGEQKRDGTIAEKARKPQAIISHGNRKKRAHPRKTLNRNTKSCTARGHNQDPPAEDNGDRPEPPAYPRSQAPR